MVTANPLWTDTGLIVSNGQTVHFLGSGTWTSDNYATTWGPGGETYDDGSTDLLLERVLKISFFNAPARQEPRPTTNALIGRGSSRAIWRRLPKNPFFKTRS
jgi:hypothetical protein